MQGKVKKIVNGKQLGKIPPLEAKGIAEELLKKVSSENNEGTRTLLRLDLQQQALRNARSKVPAVREVANLIMEKIKVDGETQQMVTKTNGWWKQVRRAALRWARKGHVELMQVGVSLMTRQENHEELIMMQTQMDAIDVGDSPTEEIPTSPSTTSTATRRLKGDEAMFFERIQIELMRIRKHKTIGAMVTQLKAFLGADTRDRQSSPWVPDPDQLQRENDKMMAELMLELREERQAQEAQAADDRSSPRQCSRTSNASCRGSRFE